MHEDPLTTNPFCFNLVRWLFILIIVFGFFIKVPFYCEEDSGPEFEEQSVCGIASVGKEAPASDKIDHKTPEVRGEKAEHLYNPIINRVADRYQIDPALVKAIIMAESGYDSQAVSKKGAKGLMQLMPRTAEALGVEDTFDPAHNINGGVRYFKQLLRQFGGDIKLALAAYNAGSRRVQEHQGIPPIKATRYYIKKVLEHYENYKREVSREMGEV